MLDEEFNKIALIASKNPNTNFSNIIVSLLDALRAERQARQAALKILERDEEFGIEKAIEQLDI